MEVAGADQVGDYLGHDVETDRVVTHAFGCRHPGYVGWRWAVTVARASRQRGVTVDEVVLLPSQASVLSPEWLPWTERVRPGDVGAGDLMPTGPGDPRLVPGYTGAEEDLAADESFRAVHDELGLGRSRVLSVDGRDEAVERWYAGSHGPRAEEAQEAPAPCGTCGFVSPISGPFGAVFGICANAYSPSDGQVVSFDHGCGAHSEVAPASPVGEDAEPAEPVLDTFGYDEA